MIFDKIKELSQIRNMNMKQVALAIGFSENAFYKWKNSSPSIENLEKVANYFDVSTDYLLGRESRKLKQVAIDDDIVAMTFNGTELSKKERAVILATAQALIEQRESK